MVKIFHAAAAAAKENVYMQLDLLKLSENVIHTSDKDLGASTIASVVITGIAVVFIGLVILIILVSIYGKVFQMINDKAAKKAEAEKAEKLTQAPALKAASAAEKTPVVEDGIEEEIVAVITAAIAAYGAQSGKKLAVRGIRRSGGTAPRNAWGAAGLSESTRPF